MNLVFVGATNVGSMTLDFDDSVVTNVNNMDKKINLKKFDDVVSVKKGEQMGMFKAGSTVVAIFEAPESFKFNIKEGDTIRYGEPFGKF